MTEPKIPARTPYVLDVQPGAYAWCACGRSKTQPYCDGSHAGTGIVPKIVTIDAAGKVAWCGCKHTCTKPFCDGSHKKLPG
jgi:CDGSH-type Zn-finger protein